MLLKPFESAENEGFVLDDRPTCAEAVVPKTLFCFSSGGAARKARVTGVTVVPAICIQNLIVPKPERGAMKSIRPGLETETHDTAVGNTALRSEPTGLSVDFLNRLHARLRFDGVALDRGIL